MTRQVFEVDHRHLQAAAEAMVGVGVEKAIVSVAPRLNCLRLAGEAAGGTVSILIAGEGSTQSPAIAAPVPDPLEFVFEERTKSGPRATRSRTPEPLSIPDDQIPF